MLTPIILVHYPDSVEEYTEKIKKTFGKTVYQSNSSTGSDLETQLGLCKDDIFVVDLFDPFLENVIYKGYKTIAIVDQDKKIEAIYPEEDREMATQWNRAFKKYLTDTGIKDLSTVIVVDDYNEQKLTWDSINNILAL